MNPIEFYREHRSELDVFSDPRAAFLLGYINMVKRTSMEDLSIDLGWQKTELESVWLKLKSAGFVSANGLTTGVKRGIRLSSAGEKALKLWGLHEVGLTAANARRENIPQLFSTQIRELFEKGRAAHYGLTVDQFQIVLEQVATKYAPNANQQQKLQLWKELRLEELVLARACAAGHDAAWQAFLTRFREKLYDIARGITKEDSSARDLADSLYADLYGTSERDGRRVSRLNFYMGRGSLEGWLRTVLAQEFVNRYRKTKRLVSLEEQAEDGVQFSAAAPAGPTSPLDSRLGAALDEALGQLAAEDRLVLASYYLDDRTLTEIGRVVGVHESTISRRLEKLLKTLRKQVLAGLVSRGMNRGQAEEALEADVRYLQVDVTRKLQENRPAAFQQDKGPD